MVRNMSYNGYGSYFVAETPSISTRRIPVNGWVEVDKRPSSVHKNAYTNDQNIRNWSDCKMDTHFPLSFLYDSDDDEEDDVNVKESSDVNDDEIHRNGVSESYNLTCKRSTERERHFSIIHENDSNIIYVDEEGDELPSLVGECDDVPQRDHGTNDFKIPHAKHRKRNSDADDSPYISENLCDRRHEKSYPEVILSSGIDVVGTRVAKYFKKVLHTGIVTEYLPPITIGDDPWWQIVYDDSDQEQWDISELNAGISLYNEVEKKLYNLEVNCSNSINISCVESSDSEESIECYVQPSDDDSDFVPSSSDECEDSVSIVIDYYFVNHFLLIYIYVCLCRFLL